MSRDENEAIVRRFVDMWDTQKWRWIVVTDPAKRRSIGEIYRKGGSAIASARDSPGAPTTSE